MFIHQDLLLHGQFVKPVHIVFSDVYVLHNITIMITLAYTVTSENIYYHKLFNQQASYLMLTNGYLLPFSPHCILFLVLPLAFSPTHFFFPPSVPPISLSFLLLMYAAPLWRRT